VGGVRVSVNASAATSAADGTYSLPNLSAPGSLVLAYSKDGYLPTSEGVVLVPGVSTPLDVVLVPLATPAPLDATAGGTVTGMRGATLTAGPGAFVDSTGSAVSGSVDVYLRPLDPALALERVAYPGSLVGLQANGSQGMLQTYGVLDVTVMQGGQRLQIAPGRSVTVTIPGTVAGTLPSQGDLWSFNPTTAIWDHEGTASLANGTFTATLPHLSFWNVDMVLGGGQATCLIGRIVDSAGRPTYSARVSASTPGQSYSMESWNQSIATGSATYCIWVEPNVQIELTATQTSASQGSKGVLQGSITVASTAGEPYQGLCSQAVNCLPVPDIQLGVNASSDGGAPPASSCSAQSADADGGDAGDDAAANPFAGTCAAPLLTFFQCFNAAGGCSSPITTADADGGNFSATITYGTGASIQVSGSGTTDIMTFFGPGGTRCGSGVSGPSTGGDLLLSLPKGEFVLGKSTVECPDGTMVALTSDQSSTLGGCQSIGSGCGNAGSDGGSTTGDLSCTYSSGGSVGECILYKGLGSSSAVANSCTQGTGQVGTSCTATGRVGCCQSQGNVMSTCYYSGAASDLAMACGFQKGTWSAN
jgi:hypothetical protein